MRFIKILNESMSNAITKKSNPLQSNSKKLHPLRAPKEQEAERKFLSIYILFLEF